MRTRRPQPILMGGRDVRAPYFESSKLVHEHEYEAKPVYVHGPGCSHDYEHKHEAKPVYVAHMITITKLNN
ncbi:MAG: hypothetical protein K2X77_33370 [Candidatus Obscuribacterales bacterium]|nr:hypothetical protein [Candidatus Obscuribacterales bacterium]